MKGLVRRSAALLEAVLFFVLALPRGSSAQILRVGDVAEAAFGGAGAAANVATVPALGLGTPPLSAPALDARAFPAAAPPPRLIIAGAPGSGKGEASKRLARDYGIVHVSSGELLREHALPHPDVAAAMNRGELVPTELVVGLVRERLSRPDAVERGFILDGSPRRLEEAEQLRAEIAAGRIAVDALILLDVPEDELLRRVLGRGRSDDSEDVFRRRLDIYRRDTVPAVASLARDLPVLTPDVATAAGVEESYARVKAAVEAHRARTPP
jgi:adenylate kinase